MIRFSPECPLTQDDIEFYSPDEILSSWGSWDSGIMDRALSLSEWDILLSHKRSHKSFIKTFDRLSFYGFLCPLSYVNDNGLKSHGDGHHRLAAAIDLGYKTIPYLRPHKGPSHLLRLKSYSGLYLGCKP